MSWLLVVTAVVFLAILVVDSKVRYWQKEQREITTWTGLGMVQGVLKAMNAQSNARGDAEERSTRSRASSFAISAAKSACACLRDSMEIRVSAPATITGRPRTEGPSAHRFSTTTFQHCH